MATTPEEDRATAIVNKHKKFGKDCMCGSGDILADRHTDTQTHTDVLITIQYFAIISNNLAENIVSSPSFNSSKKKLHKLRNSTLGLGFFSSHVSNPLVVVHH